MIAQLEGTVIHTDPRALVLDVHGVGYKVWIGSESLQKKAKKGPEMVRIWTYLSVRETALDLYGFANAEELETFELLITISGIGPKTAAGILNVVSIATIRSAIASNDPSYLTKVSGIGKKNAEKIVRELSDKIGVLESDVPTESMRHDSDVIEALKSLGYAEREAREALKKVPADDSSAGERVKKALKILSNK
ncbi:TPA: Holliday junction branch migration protein RuvA [Candidatus Taylorbacteria bacterium]|nr:Holliday junction branch migration protein RuvA [Candidatus Taylorbacteria bacterium]